MDKIQQFMISKGCLFFQSVYEQVYGLTCVNEEGYDQEAPCLFIGQYMSEDFQNLRMHKGKAVMLWAGSDAYSARAVELVRSIPNVVITISISKWIQDRLDHMGIRNKRVDIAVTNPDDWKPSKLGDKIYTYVPDFKYGIVEVDMVERMIPFEIIRVKSPHQHTREELKKIYDSCFIGLRLTRWDGPAATVQELGLMGRRSTWNGGSPSSIPWSNTDDVVKAIQDESKNIGKVQNNISRMTKESIETGTSWLEI